MFSCYYSTSCVKIEGIIQIPCDRRSSGHDSADVRKHIRVRKWKHVSRAFWKRLIRAPIRRESQGTSRERRRFDARADEGKAHERICCDPESLVETARDSPNMDRPVHGLDY